MKKIKIRKEIWQELCQIRSEQSLSNFSKTIEYVLKGEKQLRIKELEHNEKPLQNLEESLQEIQNHVDKIKPKALEEKVITTQSGIELQCQQCGSIPFKLEEVVCDEFGILCPFCGYFHSTIIVQEEDKTEI